MRKRLAIILAMIVIAVGIVAAAATPRLLAVTSTPEFCNSCHVMNDQYEAWFMTGVHRTIQCVDCHLPHDNIVNHFIWKGIEGTRDVVFFHSGIFDEPIELSERGKQFVQTNCIRCHEGIVSRIEADTQNCWSCHRRMSHKTTVFDYRLN